MSSSIDLFFTLNWHIFITVLCVWECVCVCVWRGFMHLSVAEKLGQYKPNSPFTAGGTLQQQQLLKLWIIHHISSDRGSHTHTHMQVFAAQTWMSLSHPTLTLLPMSQSCSMAEQIRRSVSWCRVEGSFFRSECLCYTFDTRKPWDQTVQHHVYSLPVLPQYVGRCIIQFTAGGVYIFNYLLVILII